MRRAGAWAAVLLLLGCAVKVPSVAQPAGAEDRGQRAAQGPPPPPGPVRPNASRVVATVLERSVWPAGSLERTRPLVPSDQTLYSLRVEIHAAEAEQPGLRSHARQGVIIEAFSAEALPADLVGKTIRATLKLTGDTRAVRWWISSVSVQP